MLKKGYNMQIDQQGYYTMLDKHGRFMAKAKMTPNWLFSFKIKYDKFPYFSFVMHGDNWLWQMDYGHYHFSRLNYLSRKKLVSGLSVVKISNYGCDTCNWKISMENHFLLENYGEQGRCCKLCI